MKFQFRLSKKCEQQLTTHLAAASGAITVARATINETTKYLAKKRRPELDLEALRACIATIESAESELRAARKALDLAYTFKVLLGVVPKDDA